MYAGFDRGVIFFEMDALARAVAAAVTARVTAGFARVGLRLVAMGVIVKYPNIFSAAGRKIENDRFLHMTSRGRSTSPRRRRHTVRTTGFIAFYTEQYQDLSKQYEDENGRKASVTEISKIAAQKYSKLDASIKAKYSVTTYFFQSDGSRRREDLDAVVPECAEAKVTVKNATKDATKDATKNATKNSTKNATPENEAKDVAENVTSGHVEQDEQGSEGNRE